MTNSDLNYEPISEPISMARKSSVGNASFPYHRHDACEIFLFLSGNIDFYIEQTCFSPAPGSLIILNPQEMHRIQSLDNAPYDRIVINLQKEYMDALSPDGFSLANCFYSRPLGLHNVRVLSPDSLNEFLSLYERLESGTASDCFGSAVIRNAYTSLLLLLINREFQSDPSVCHNRMPQYIVGSMQYISSHLTEPIRLSILAKKYHISECYLSSQFKFHTGMTLRSYLLDRKIHCARLLLQKGASVTEACYGSGFNDYANFIRSFKKITGVSPGKYIRQDSGYPDIGSSMDSFPG